MIAAKQKAASQDRCATRERYEQIEERSAQAFTILATMTVASAIICCFGPWIPEPLCISAAITMLCSGAGSGATMLIRLDNILRHLDSM